MAAASDLGRPEKLFRLLALVLDQIEDHVCVTDLDGRITYANEAQCRSLGRRREELIGRITSEVYVNQGGAGPTQDEIVQATRQQGFWRGTVANPAGDGTTHLLECSVTQVCDETGHAVGMCGIGRNVTARTRAERELRDSEERYRLLAENISDVLAEKEALLRRLQEREEELRALVASVPGAVYRREPDAPGRFTYLSDGIAAILDLPLPASGAGLNWADVVHPDDLPHALASIRAAVAGQAPFLLEYRVRRGSGEIRWVQDSGRPVPGSGNGPGSVAGIILDVTDRREAESSRQKALAELETIYAAVPLAMLVVDRDRRVRQVNPAAARFGQRNPGEFMGLRGGDAIRCAHAQDDPRGCGFGPLCSTCPARRAVEATLADRQARRGIEAWFAIGGPACSEQRCLELGTAYLESGGEERVLLIAADITERKHAEEEVLRRESLLRTILHTTRDGFWRLNMQGRVIDCNDAYCALTGYSREELLGLSIKDLDALEQLEETAARIGRVVARGSEKFDTRHRRKDGSAFDVEVSVTYMPAEGGQMVCFCRDITARKNAEEALRRSEAKFRSYVENAPMGILVADTAGRHVQANRAAEQMLGYEPGGLVGGFSFDLPDPADRLRAQQHFAEVQRRGLADGEFRLRRKDGSGIWASVRAALLSDGHLLALLQDISPRKRAEAALKESEERFRAAFEASPDGICITRVADGKYLCVNEGFTRVTGYTAEDTAASTSLQQQVWRNPEDRARIVAELRKCGFVANVEAELRCKDGTIRAALASVRALDINGEPHALTVLRDITERKLAEAQLAQAHKMESVGRLAGGVAHDFNNLLTVINGYSQLILSRLHDSDPIRDTVEEIRKAGGRAASLTRQLLAFSRKQILQPRLVDVGQLVQELLPMLARLVGEDVAVAVEAPADPAVVRADPNQLEQVVVNLAVNARDAMPQGGRLTIQVVHVRWDPKWAQLHPDAAEGPYVQVRVSDTGTGMDPETCRRVFEPFFTTKAPGQGTGLGLAMVQGIVAQSGGFIEIDSEPGRGTTFRICLPRVGEAPTLPPEPGGATVAGGSETLLVVEDQDDVREFAAAALQRYGYRVIQAQSPMEALEIVQQSDAGIDLVLTDVIMPQMSGRDLALQLSRIRPDLKVLYMSGYTDNVLSEHGVPGGPARLIEKPFTAEALAGRVREALGSARPAVRVLVVDDDDAVRRFLRSVLEDEGYEVTEAADGKQALQEAGRRGLDLVITDLVMPEQEGIETIRALREQFPALPIIAISGASGAPYLKMAALLGANAVLGKPVSAEQLLAKVGQVLRQGCARLEPV